MCGREKKKNTKRLRSKIRDFFSPVKVTNTQKAPQCKKSRFTVGFFFLKAHVESVDGESEKMPHKV